MFTKQVIKGDVYIVSLIEELVIVTMSLEHLATINYFYTHEEYNRVELQQQLIQTFWCLPPVNSTYNIYL